MTHQFFIAGGEKPRQSESEMITVGGLDQVDTTCLKAFDLCGDGTYPQTAGDGKTIGFNLLWYASEILCQ